MIESITVTNYLGESIEMVLTQPELSGFIVKSIDGIGPANANINMMELATIDGSIFNSARLNTRDISLSLLFMQNPDIGINNIEEARRLSYKYFPIKKPVTLTFKTDAVLGDHNPIHVIGYVEKNEPKIFQKQEGTTITIKCPDPYFHSLEQSNEMFFGTEPLFEFTYSNEIDPNAEREYSTYDTYDESGNLLNGMIKYNQVGDPIILGPITGTNSVSRSLNTDTDKVELIVTMYSNSYQNGREVYHGYATTVANDPDNRVVVLSEGDDEVLSTAWFAVVRVSVEGGAMTITLGTLLSPMNYSFTLTIIRYQSYGIIEDEVIYYEDLNDVDVFDNIGINEEVIKTYTYEKLGITLFADTYSRLYSKSITMVDSDLDDSVIKVPDGTEDLELFSYGGFGKLYISRSGDEMTLRFAAAWSSSFTRTLRVRKYDAIYHYKDVYNTEFGNVSSIAEGNIWYEGDGETGLIIDIIFHGNATGIAIYDKESGEMMSFNDDKLRSIAGSILYGDILRINTNLGQKSVTYIRKNQTFDALNALNAPLQWFKLTHGENIFGYDAETGLENLVFDIRYDILYEGV